MNIGELGKRTGLTNSRIRFYERAGLLKAADRQPNGYRAYTPDAVLVLDLIATAQKAGFSLEEIRALIPADLGDWQHDRLVKALRGKIADIDAMQTRLRQTKAGLAALLADIEARPDDTDCAANARRVLSRVLGDEGARAASGTRAEKPRRKGAARRAG